MLGLWQSVHSFITPSSVEWYMKPPIPCDSVLPCVSFFTWWQATQAMLPPFFFSGSVIVGSKPMCTSSLRLR